MAQTQPNVIWVLTDQQRAMMLSCNGDPNVHTPNIDAWRTWASTSPAR